MNEETEARTELVAHGAEEVARRLSQVRARISATGRNPEDVKIVAVTKGFGASAIASALRAGLRDIGENYAQELLAKFDAFCGDKCNIELDDERAARWHYLGTIQRRKVRDIAKVVSLWQSVSRREEAEAISKHSPGAAVLVEVEATGLPGRNGCPVEGARTLAELVWDLGLDLRGLMTVGPPGGEERSREVFRTVARLGESLGLAELSMGMSDDLEAAVQEGATMVRIGRALFGERDTICR